MESLETTIRVKKETKDILDDLKLIERESYDSVIRRMAEFLLEDKLELTRKTQTLIMDSLNAAQYGKVMSGEELLNRMKEKRGMQK